MNSVETRRKSRRKSQSRVPYWDERERKLYFAGKIIKAYRSPAKNQISILRAFEDAGWVEWISDPLPETYLDNPKLRLHDVVKSLNRNQKNKLIRFHGDGTGQGVWWEVVWGS